MANDTTDTTDTHDIEYPVTGYDATPDWATLYGQAFEQIDQLLADGQVGVTTVASASDLVDGEPGFYHLEDEDSVVWFDGDTSTN
ncbi:hypothetical protein [Haloarcula sp. CBA1122]|uniref:hypothetical protein n=1 Tax=Haloarcula sp. CBA1122 TaxID=2668069 RepID=UPI001306AAF6|nr:hypothetical protein [Haloarcula sp. CBA1122]MUV50974.1 hypothetical protein [Haloarcula sp. CBA1122]